MTSLAALRERDFRLVLGAYVTSLIGDGVLPIALAFAILDLTDSATDIGIVLAVRAVALVVSLLFGGVLADRMSARVAMIGADVVRLLSQGVLGVLLVTGVGMLWQIAALQAVLGAATGLFNPASSSLMPQVVRSERLQEANALRGIAEAGGWVVGPAIAGILVAVAGPGEAVLVDAATYGVSALLLSRVRARVAPAAEEPFLRNLREGWNEFRRRTWVWVFVVSATFGTMFGATFIVLGPLVAERSLGGAGAWATILAVRAIGSIVGGVLALRLKPRRPLVVATCAVALFALPLFALAVPAQVAVIAVVAAFGGAGLILYNALWDTALQQHIPADRLARVSAYDWFATLAFQPIGLALAGPIAASVGVSATLVGAGILQLVVIVAVLAVRDVWSVRPPVAAGSA
jgi:predicted MFS family arabinose efflux permease